MEIVCRIYPFEDEYNLDGALEKSQDSPMVIRSYDYLDNTEGNLIYFRFNKKEVIVDGRELISAIQRCMR